MKADLHVHTDISDGSNTLEETIKIAKENNVTHIGIVNHDTIRGLKEAIKVGKKEGIKIIPGIEISAFNFKGKKKVHILGFNFDLQGRNIKRICDPILEKRHNNSLWQINQLTMNGYQIDYGNILSSSRSSQVIYKQHIMAELIDKGYTDEIYSDLYKKLFKKDGICARDIEYVDVFEAVRAIKADNGIAILAHPGQINSYDLIDELVKVGLDGIELNHEDHDDEDLARIWEYKDKYNLILTGGSDYHGIYGSQINIGEIVSPNEYIHIFDRALERNIHIASLYNEGEIMAEEVVKFIEEIVREAGNYLKGSINNDCYLIFKNNDFRDVVTKHDIEIENFLVERIAKRYPSHSFITEEKTHVKQGFSDYTWIIDPIDGTTNFVSMGKNFGISVALYKNKKPFLGVVYDVIKEEMYSAISGKGAYLNGIRIDKRNSDFNLKDSLIDISLNSINILHERKGINLFKLAKDIRGHRAYGSASLSICKIALGELQGYMSAKLSLWDYAAAIIILMEAGGCYTYFDESGIEDFPLDEVVFIATENQLINNEIISKLKEYKCE